MMLGAMTSLRSGGRATIFRLTAVLAAAVAALAIVLAGGSHSANAAAGPASSNSFGQGMFGISADGAIQNESAGNLNHDLNIAAGTGAKWLRVSINWAQIQRKRRGAMYWTAIDRVVKDAEARGMSVLGTLIYTPPWAEARKTCRTADCAPNVAYFAKFARVAVAHYSKLGVHAYEVWNEENSTAQWLPKPDPKAYAKLLRLAYPAIKAAAPNTTVITGGTSPASTDGTNYAPADYLRALYRDGAKGYFDAVGAHPYTWPAYPGQAVFWSAWYQTYGAANSMRNVMVAHGDGRKLIWGTEFGAPTNGPKTGSGYVTQAKQGRIIYDGFKLWATYKWAGPLLVYTGRDPGTDRTSYYDWMGLVFHNWKPKQAYSAYKSAVKAF